MKKKFFIATTIPASLNFFKGHLRFLNEHFRVSAISSDLESLELIGKREEISIFHIPMVRPISLFKDIWCLLRFIFLFLKEQPHIVHGNTPKASFLSMIAAWITRVPVRIYMCHGLRYQGEANIYKRKLLMRMEKITCKCATKVICVSYGVRNTLISDGICSDSKAIVVHHGSAAGIDTNHFCRDNVDIKTTIHEELGIKKEDFTFVFIGRIVQDKGINELIRAFCKLLESYNHVHLVLVGPNDIDTKKISKETKQLIKSTANIHAVGVQKDIRPYLLNANALVLPSYREGFGMVLIEAGAMSVPAIASDIIGCNEIIISGKNGELISAKNPDALLETMKKWVESPEYVNQLSLNAREMVMERYSQEIVWRNMLATYQNLSASIKHK
jgi:glycosyltransferase involved in cell wall biosynthesis